MKNVYEECPVFENEHWLLRFVEKSDSEALLKVYGDKNALPFFNSDNCDGDNFYYHTKELMDKAMDFWFYSYREKWFVRWAIIDKASGKAIGTIPKMILMSLEFCVLMLEALMKRLRFLGKSWGLLFHIFLKCLTASRL